MEARRGLTRQIDELVATSRWSAENAEVSIRAGHRCEYCGLDFFASLNNYRLWQRDHIVPVSAGGKDEMSSYAAACFPCNVIYKAQWDPMLETGPGANREQLLDAVSKYVANRRARDERLFEGERAIVRSHS